MKLVPSAADDSSTSYSAADSGSYGSYASGSSKSGSWSQPDPGPIVVFPSNDVAGGGSYSNAKSYSSQSGVSKEYSSPDTSATGAYSYSTDNGGAASGFSSSESYSTSTSESSSSDILGPNGGVSATFGGRQVQVQIVRAPEVANFIRTYREGNEGGGGGPYH